MATEMRLRYERVLDAPTTVPTREPGFCSQCGSKAEQDSHGNWWHLDAVLCSDPNAEFIALTEFSSYQDYLDSVFEQAMRDLETARTQMDDLHTAFREQTARLAESSEKHYRKVRNMVWVYAAALVVFLLTTILSQVLHG